MKSDLYFICMRIVCLFVGHEPIERGHTDYICARCMTKGV